MALTNFQLDRALGAAMAPLGYFDQASAEHQQVLSLLHLLSASPELTASVTPSPSDKPFASSLGSIAALAFLGPEDSPELARYARQLAAKYQLDDEDTDLCIIWAMMTRVAVIHGRGVLEDQLIWLPESHQQQWRDRFQAFAKKGIAPFGPRSTRNDSLKRMLWVADQMLKHRFTKDSASASIGTVHPTDQLSLAIVYTLVYGYKATAQLIPFSRGASDSLEEVSDLVSRIVESSPTGPWAGNDADAMLKRAASNVVIRTSSMAPTSDFHSLEEVRNWLDQCAQQASSAARFEVFLAKEPDLNGPDEGAKPYTLLGLDHIHSPLSDREVPEQCLDVKERSWYPIGFDPNFLGDSFCEHYFSFEYTPSIEAVYEGQLLTEIHGTLTIESESSQRFIARVPQDQQLEEDQWLLIRPAGTPSFIPVPARTALLELVFDHDGASVSLKAYGTKAFTERITAENHFNATWAQWLDDDAVLSEAQLQRGVAKAEEIARTAINMPFHDVDGAK